MATQKQAMRAKRRHSTTLLDTPGVLGVGVRRAAPNDYVVVLYLDGSFPDEVLAIPPELDGVPTTTEMTGTFRPQVAATDALARTGLLAGDIIKADDTARPPESLKATDRSTATGAGSD